jgi:hypothetical protein
MTDLPSSAESPQPSLSPTVIPPSTSMEERLAVLYPDDDTDADDEIRPKEQPETASKPAPGLPEKYDLKVPDGYTLDAGLLEEATPVFRELGLSNESAGKLMPLATKVIERFQDRQQDAFDELKTDWAREAKNDPKIGGKNWAETERLMAVALKAGGAPVGSEFRELMNESGIGNHPAMIRFMRQVGHALSRTAGRTTPPKLSRTEILYPND